MRKLLIAVAAVAATAAIPTTAGAETRPPIPDRVPTGCELQEKLGIVNVRACEDPYSA